LKKKKKKKKKEETAMRLVHTSLAAVATLVFTAAASAETIQGSYVEARSAVPATPADQPNQVVLAWQVGQGAYKGQKLDGQTIIAVVTSEPAVGASAGRTRTVFFVDGRASLSVRTALAHLAKDLAPGVIHDAGEFAAGSIDVRIAEGCGCGAAVVECPLARLRTRRMTDADQASLPGVKNGQPLGDVFSSHQVIATEFACGSEQAAGTGGAIAAFTGSFAK
jgi:hypothetical protein